MYDYNFGFIMGYVFCELTLSIDYNPTLRTTTRLF